MSAPNPLEAVRVALAASAQAGEPDVAAMYLAVARTSLTCAAEELRQLEVLLVEREREAARSSAPRQLSIAREAPRS